MLLLIDLIEPILWRGNRNDKAVVKIGSSHYARSGGGTAPVEILSELAWYGIAASLGFTALVALKTPLNILGRLDDLAQDLENLQLDDEMASPPRLESRTVLHTERRWEMCSQPPALSADL